jgi:hypothetical protein
MLIDMAEENFIPTVDGHDIFKGRNILPELRRAWEDAHAAGGFDDAEFPFEIKISYRDARHRTFETKVAMKYCPLEEDAAKKSIFSGHRGEWAILKLTNTDITRLVSFLVPLAGSVSLYAVGLRWYNVMRGEAGG